ncbi:MAG: peptidyl-prolyl cis-trans isomerase A [Candidatus Dactylopiibacterium carminicum]|uniref:Peptidyl-prolyl cis-trans isomerase n=1 Tax=Candidatus Dactylopiibacterium carminicum TaxID=857335 RepID=A0A272ERU3_9RHOO|nr:peptidylprolyl isomerase [Candidatus Dactylopiibacterium carminicum]KAF7598878.1 peptidyl-prolyl cis-trans isomerase A [Candidatus Dactylopiibacterium carminicum]PAS92824.1 MAG: peptidyl-prolyl cis-trans isomerase A [Candidatus Dactylopiibacterium carminicum]PAS96276.1 MAG: peptidyl-prolyl cis-trans isomerase A [Candidatus Dactylopiibacterium carminicum]PAS98896.1 MAG: peptidyl-prolyl cis-trans isomerase A [Candidatus Dactylopiibacterium carminicum]
MTIVSTLRRAFLLAGLAIASLSAAAAGEAPRVQLATNQGNITLELDAQRAPASVANFLQYVEAGHYDGTIFHRVIRNFMIQGGGFTPDMNQKPTKAPIQNEAKNGLKNVRGSIAMARTGAPHSATSQFFINTVDNSFLDFPGQDGWGYTVFGKVVEGMDVVDKIRAVPTTNAGPHSDVPRMPVIIQSARLLPTGTAGK